MSDIDKSKELLKQIAAERAKGTRQGRIVLVVVLSMFAVTIGSVWYRISHFDTRLLESEIERQTSTRIWPMVAKETDAIAADAVPALSAALVAEAAEFMPKVSERLAAEGELFQTHSHEKMTAALDAHFASAVAEHGDALKARYPQFAANPERYDALITKLRSHAQDWAQGQLDSTFAQHIVVLQSINTSITALAAEGQDKAAEEKSMDDVMSLFLEIMNTRLEGKG